MLEHWSLTNLALGIALTLSTRISTVGSAGKDEVVPTGEDEVVPAGEGEAGRCDFVLFGRSG